MAVIYTLPANSPLKAFAFHAIPSIWMPFHFYFFLNLKFELQ